MQIVDVLRAQDQVTPALLQTCFQPSQGAMCLVRFSRDEVRSTSIVEGMDLIRVMGERLGVASVKGSNRDQIPPLSRKVPNPLSAETPAPVRTKTLI